MNDLTLPYGHYWNSLASVQCTGQACQQHLVKAFVLSHQEVFSAKSTNSSFLDFSLIIRQEIFSFGTLRIIAYVQIITIHYLCSTDYFANVFKVQLHRISTGHITQCSFSRQSSEQNIQKANFLLLRQTFVILRRQRGRAV